MERVPFDKKRKPVLTFYHTLKIPFTLSGTDKQKIDFNNDVKNRGSDAAKVLRKIHYKKLGIEKESELGKFPMIKKAHKIIREEILKNLGIGDDGSHSEMMWGEIKEYVKK